MSADNNTTSVEYRVIPWAPCYRFGSDGSAWSCYVRGCRGLTSDTWRKLTPGLNRKYNRYFVGMHINGKRRNYNLARLVLEAFVGPCPPGMIACHYPDPTPTNCRLDNLRWDTHQANSSDAIRQGRNQRGSTHHAAKLTEDIVVKMRALRSVGWPIKAIAAMYDVSPSTASVMFSGKTWYHVAPDGSTIVEEPAVIAPESLDTDESYLRDFDVPLDELALSRIERQSCSVGRPEVHRLIAEVRRLRGLLSGDFR